MTTYTRIVTDYPTYIVFDDEDIDFFKEINGVTESEDEEVTVDPNNCVKVWTYDNEYEENPPSIEDRTPYVFDNMNDFDTWIDYNNGDGHQNFPYHGVIVKDGVETEFDPY